MPLAINETKIPLYVRSLGHGGALLRVIIRQSKKSDIFWLDPAGSGQVGSTSDDDLPTIVERVNCGSGTAVR